MRIFVALSVPDSVKQHARMFRNRLGQSRADIKWVEYQNYHLTVKFLGEVHDALLPEIRHSLKLAADSSPAFNLGAGGLGFFPNQRRPRVLWVGIKGELEKAQFLAERVDAYLSPLGFEEEKEHRFHLTLGRFRSELHQTEMLKLYTDMEGKDKLSTFKVVEFDLMKSTLTPEGPVYSVLDTFYLNG